MTTCPSSEIDGYLTTQGIVDLDTFISIETERLFYLAYYDFETALQDEYERGLPVDARVAHCEYCGKSMVVPAEDWDDGYFLCRACAQCEPLSSDNYAEDRGYLI